MCIRDRLLSVSWHPPPFRTPPCWLVRAAPLFIDTPPSALLDVPHAVRSTIRESGNEHGVAVAPHPKVVAMLAKAILPLLCDIARLVVVRSGVAGRLRPLVPAAPSCTSRYLPAGIVVPAGKAYRLLVEAAKLPVAEPYCNDHPVNVTGLSPLLNTSA